MHEVHLRDNIVTLIDDIDIELVEAHRWYLDRRPHTDYAYTIFDKRMIKLQTLLLDPPSPLEVDHIDRNGLNNQRHNLRIASRSRNLVNRIMPQGPKGSGYRGVYRDRNRWRAKIAPDSREQLHLGTFDCPIEAAIAYDNAARIYHGEFAVLNFP